MLLASYGVGDGDVGGALFGHPEAAVRALAVERVGRLLRQAWGGHAAGPVRDRAVAAWERAKAAGLTAEVGAAFATWAPIEGFDTGWVLGELDAALAASGGEATDGYRLVDWLATASAEDAEGAVRALDRLSHSDRIGLDLQGQAEAARTVIRAAVGAGGEAARVAREAASRLTLRTRTDFTRDLPPRDDG